MGGERHATSTPACIKVLPSKSCPRPLRGCKLAALLHAAPPSTYKTALKGFIMGWMQFLTIGGSKRGQPFTAAHHS